MATKTRLVRVGNSRGVRLPKSLIQQAGIGEEVELRVRGSAIVVTAVKRPRDGWAEAARQLAEERGDRLDRATPTRFEETEWRW